MPPHATQFEAYPYVNKALPDGMLEKSAYRVYTSATESVSQEAASAQEALKLSGIENPLRIVRENTLGGLILDSGMFQ